MDAKSGPEPATGDRITPELVREVTKRVYALWLRDLKLARERRRLRDFASSYDRKT